MKKYEISKEEYEAIKAKEKATRDKKVSERLKVLMHIYEGYVCSDFEFAEEAQASFALHFRLFRVLAIRLTCA